MKSSGFIYLDKLTKAYDGYHFQSLFFLNNLIERMRYGGLGKNAFCQKKM